MKVIIISVTKYKEKDGIVDAIGKEGPVTFLARSVLDPKSKTAGLNNVLTIADVTFTNTTYKHPVLKEVDILESPMVITYSIEYLSSVSLLAELTKKLLQDEDKAKIYPWLEGAILSLKKEKTPWLTILIYIANIMKITGYEFEVNQCVFCGTKKDIISFSFEDGGYVCRNCATEETSKDLTPNQMNIIRFIYNTTNYDYMPSEKMGIDDMKYVLNKFKEFIQEGFGITLKSLEMLNN